MKEVTVSQRLVVYSSPPRGGKCHAILRHTALRTRFVHWGTGIPQAAVTDWLPEFTVNIGLPVANKMFANFCSVILAIRFKPMRENRHPYRPTQTFTFAAKGGDSEIKQQWKTLCLMVSNVFATCESGLSRFMQMKMCDFFPPLSFPAKEAHHIECGYKRWSSTLTHEHERFLAQFALPETK